MNDNARTALNRIDENTGFITQRLARLKSMEKDELLPLSRSSLICRYRLKEDI